MINTFLRHALGLVCALALGPIMVGQAAAERRVALIVGNAKYEHADTLANTLNDANAIAALLTKAGFDVVDERRDVGVVEFKRAIREFLNAASTADIAVVYYSGHGIEIGGVNYLIPVDAKLASEYDVDDEAIPLDRLILATQAATKLSLIILDACRDNPFLRAAARVGAKRSIGNRLVGVDPTGADTLIAFAAKAGSVSYDGNGANSPFTTALVKYLTEPGLDIRIALGKVRDDVLASTGNRQEPFVYGSLGGGDVSLVAAPVAPKVAAGPTVVDPNAAAAADYAMAERVGSLAGWQAFLAAHNSGYYASLARAQLAKLAAADASGSPGAASEPQKKAGGPSGASPQDNARRATEDAAQPKDERQAALPTPVAIGISRTTPGQACKSDEARLAQLRLNPDVEQVAKFSREFACEDLRPQVRRFMESLGLAPTQEPQGSAADAAGAAKPIDASQACKRDAEELARIRANPDRDSATRFARELKCEQLRAQAARLLDSVGD